MTRRRRTDYQEVLKAICEVVPSMRRNIKEVCMDFEVPVWQAAKEVFGSETVLRGCVYHWSKAVWGKCLEYQLRLQYESNKYVREVIHWVLALPYLPPQHIEEAFVELQRMASLKPSLTRLFQCIETTWILGFWTPEDWSAYQHPVRSEVDVEGWVQRMTNDAGRPSLPHHQLIMLLYRESQAMEGHMWVARKGKVIVEQRKTRLQIDTLFVKWQRYEEGQLSVSLLLSDCSQLRGALW